MKTLIKNIEKWAEDKNIHKADNLQPQLLSMVEEVGEVAECIRKGRPLKDLQSEIGDVAITSIILALQSGTNIEECLKIAYEKIKDRTGKKINGTFVKDKNIFTEDNINKWQPVPNGKTGVVDYGYLYFFSNPEKTQRVGKKIYASSKKEAIKIFFKK